MRAARLPAVALVCCLSMGGAWASESESRLQQGQAQLLSGHFTEAIRQLDLAARRTYSRETLARIQLLRAQCFEALGDGHGAEDALRQALQADPEAKLDPKKILPALVNRLEALRAGLRGTLDLTADPAGTTLRVDGRVLPGTGFRGELPVGRHLVELVNPSGAVMRRTVQVRPDEVTSIQLHFVSPEPVAPQIAPAPPPVVEAAPVRAPAALSLAVSARAYAVLGSGAGIEGTLGLRGKLWLVDVGVLGGRTVGLTLRAGAEARDLLGPFGGFVAAEGVLLVSAAVPGVGAEAGVSYHPVEPVDLFIAVNYVHLLGQTGFVADSLLLGGGIRVRLPLLR